MGSPETFTDWIMRWVEGRSGFIEIGNWRPDWFPIRRGGAQVEILTLTLFITYHTDTRYFLSYASSQFFVGNFGSTFTTQYLDPERKRKLFFDQ
jgi:hypothetical protein